MHTYNLQHQVFIYHGIEIISFSFKLDDKSQVVKGLRITETLGNDWVCDSWAGSCLVDFCYGDDAVGVVRYAKIAGSQ